MFKNIRNILAVIVAGIVLTYAAFAGVDNASMPTIGGLGIIAETGVGQITDAGFVGTVIFFESDDTLAYTGPGLGLLDTGTEACAVYGMSCADVYVIDPAGASGDEFTDSTCATDQTDEVLAMAFCF